jgi:hypothetical protein
VATSVVGIAVFAGTGAFAVAAVGSSAAVAVAVAAVVAEQIVVVDGYNFAGHVAATELDDFAGFAVAVDSRRKARPWVAAAAASSRPRSPSAPGRTPHIAHSRPADRPRMEAAYYCSFSFLFFLLYKICFHRRPISHASHSSLTSITTTLERVQGSRSLQPQNVAQAEAEKFQISLALSKSH